MKNRRFIGLFVVAVLVIVCLVSCGGTETTTVAETTTSAETTDSTPATAFESLTIAGNDLSLYTIVYAESEDADEAAATPKYYPIWDYNKETAERVSDLIFELSGVRLPVACDKETAKGEYEILIGLTNRPETLSYSLKSVTVDNYRIIVAEKKLAICGGKYGTTWHAIDYVEELLKGELSKGNTAYTFAGDMDYKGSHHMLRIACVGDSITYYGTAAERAKYSYSAQIGRMLWKDALVVNYGHGGKTMRDDIVSSAVPDSYMKSDTYEKLLREASKYDIFTVMLGTNDSNRDKDWSNADTQLFKDSCETLFKSLKNASPNAEFVIANCPAYFGTANFGSLTIRMIQAQLVSEMNEKGYKTSFFNTYEVTKDIPEYYPDQLHPDADGHTVIAEAFGKMLAELIAAMKQA